MSATRSIWDPLRVRLAGARWRTAVVTWAAVMLAALCVQPLLEGGWWTGRTALVVAGVVGVGGLVRTARLPAPLQPLLQALALMVMLALLFTDLEPGWGVLPGPADLVQLRDLAAQGRDYAAATVAPAPADPGLLLIIAAGIGLVAMAVDTLAAGLDLPGLTLVPLGALFVVPWAINLGSAPAWAFAAVAFAWFAILAACQRDRASLWSVHARPGSLAAGFAAAAVTTILALLAGGLASADPPGLPGRGAGGSGGGSVTIDALVSLRRSLVNNDDRVVLTFASSAQRPDYLRLAVLEEFDGIQWQPVGGVGADPVLGPQPAAPAATAPGTGGMPLADYRMDVGPLTGSTLPSPAGTVGAPNDFPVAWDQRTSLPLRTDGRSIEGTRIALVAQPTTTDAAVLRAASTAPASAGTAPPPEALEVPGPLDGELGELAREITRDAATPFDQAVALQRWFTVGGGFRYSTEVQGGADEDALAAFLDERIGYCEQFSATMALMARSLGIPSRVLVGFTQGRAEGDVWVVRGTDAHAWPELWMGSAGWVRFEPTPGSTTVAPAYSRQAPDAASPSAAPSTPGDEASAPAGGAPDRIPESDAAGGTGPGRAASSLPRAAALATIAGLLLLVPGTVRVGVRARRRRRGRPEDAYREVADTLADLRLGTEQATPRATLAAIRAVLPPAGAGPAVGALDRIQRAVEWQRYGAGAAASDPAPRAASPRTGGAGRPGTAVVDLGPALHPGALTDDVRAVRRALADRAGLRRRVLAGLAPASLVGAVASRLAGTDRDGPAAG